MENGTEKQDRPPGEATTELTALKKVASKAVQEHEELRTKYSTLERKCRTSERERNEMNNRLRMTMLDFDNLRQASEAACKDFTDLQIQLEVESKCRVTAESFAARMVKENRDIKRKSTAFLSRAANPDFARQYTLALEEDEEELSSGGEGSAESQELHELRAHAEDLKEQLIATKRDLAIVAEERDDARAEIESARYQHQILAEQIIPDVKKEPERSDRMQDAILELVKLRREHEITKAALAEREQTLAQFRRVSTLAYQELQDVQEKYAEEVVLREKAEDFAAKMYQEKQAADAYKRQSLVMLDEAIGDDDKLKDALDQVEQLTKHLEVEKQRHKEELNEVNSKLHEASSVEHLDSLETKLSIAKEENESLEQKVNELETKNKKLALELERSSMKPVPPPPPPPPPPPMPSPQRNPLEVLRRIIGTKKASHTSPDGKIKGKDPNQKVYEATIEEMMKRIKTGKVQLKPVETQWKQEYTDSNSNQEKTLLNRERGKRLGSVKKTPAMNQLNGLVTNLKKRRETDSDNPSDETSEGASDEFTRIMRKRREKSEMKDPNSAKSLEQAKSEATAGERKPKPIPPTPAPRNVNSRLTKSASLDSGITDQPPKKSLEEQTSESSIQTCPEGDTGSVLTDSDRGSAGDIQLQTNPAFEENYSEEGSYSSIGDIATSELETTPSDHQKWVYSTLENL